MNQYICKVNNLKFNPAILHKSIISAQPVQRKSAIWPWYWSDVFKHHKGEIHSPSPTSQQSMTLEYAEFAIPQIEESLSAFGRTNNIDEMSKILQYDINDVLLNKLYRLLPEFLAQQNIRITYQQVESGTFHQIHRDHDRTSSLFYLLSEPVAETRWYTLRPDSLELFEKNNTMALTRSVSPSHCNLEYKTVIQKNQWHAFNHSHYHSVHCLPEFDHVERTSFHLDFPDLTYQQLCDLLTDNGIELTDIEQVIP